MVHQRQKCAGFKRPSRPDHSVTLSDFVSHFKEAIDRFLRNLLSGFFQHPKEGTGSILHLALPPNQNWWGGGTLTVAVPEMNYFEYLENYKF